MALTINGRPQGSAKFRAREKKNNVRYRITVFPENAVPPRVANCNPHDNKSTKCVFLIQCSTSEVVFCRSNAEQCNSVASGGGGVHSEASGGSGGGGGGGGGGAVVVLRFMRRSASSSNNNNGPSEAPPSAGEDKKSARYDCLPKKKPITFSRAKAKFYIGLKD